MSILAKVKAQRRAAMGETPAPSPAFRPLAPGEVREHNAAARETLDDYFRAVVMPGLTALFRDGRLGGFADDPAWRTVEAAWTLASEDSLTACDVGRVRALMAWFIRAKGGTVPEIPAPPRREEARAVRIRNQRTKQEVVVLSTVLASWLADGWERIEQEGKR